MYYMYYMCVLYVLILNINLLDCVASQYPQLMAIKQMKAAVDREITSKLNRQSADSIAWLAGYKKLRDEMAEEIDRPNA